MCARPLQVEARPSTASAARPTVRLRPRTAGGLPDLDLTARLVPLDYVSGGSPDKPS